MANEPDDGATPAEDEPKASNPGLTSPATKAAARKAAATTKSPGLASPATKAAARKEAAKAKVADADSGRKASRPTPKKIDAKAAARSGDPKKKAALAEESSRYTAPIPNSFKVSPWYIPALMFGFLAIGMLVIFFNYISWPFGSPSNWRLLIGLTAILAGILTATRYQ